MVLGKETPVSGEKARVQFRAELFNVFNHPNFGVPSTNLFDSARRPLADAGRITTTTTNSRQIQFGMKLLW